MADNTTLNTGTGGDVIGSDDIAGVKFQRVKLIHGVDGTNDGDVAATNPLPVDMREVVGTAMSVNAGNVDAGTQRVVLASDQASVAVDGDTAHDAAEAGNPVSTGYNAAEFAADPPQVSADNDRVRGIATPQGIQWVLGGHPNIVSREYMTTTAQTDDPIIDAVPAGSHIVVTAIEALVVASGTTAPQVRIGFGAASVPAEPASGASVDGIVLSHPAIASNSGLVRGNGSAAIAIGADGAELRITNDVPTGGQITVLTTYYITTL